MRDRDSGGSYTSRFCLFRLHSIHFTCCPRSGWRRSFMAPRGRGPAGYWRAPQPDPPLHPTEASVATPSKSVTAFECADASFAAGAPAQSGARRARAPLPRLARQDDVPDTAILRGALIAPGREAAVGDRQLRGVIEQRDVPIQARRPERAVRLAALAHRVVRNELRLGLLDLYEPTELGRLG